MSNPELKEKDGRLRSKKALITGAGTGIGKGIALEYARQGADVAIHYAHSKKGALETVEAVLATGRRVRAFEADLSRVEAGRDLGRDAADFLGGLDILVNNAGITLNQPFEEVTPEQFDTLYNVNVRAQFFLTQTVLPHLLEARDPAIINITSIHAFEGMCEHSVYAGTKGAIVAYTRELAIELSERGVRVNAIAPCAVAVESHYKVIKDYDPESMGRQIPCGFEGMPRDIAGVAVFLASPEARYIIGQTIVVDGGTTSWMPFSDAFRHRADMSFGQGYVPRT